MGPASCTAFERNLLQAVAQDFRQAATDFAGGGYDLDLDRVEYACRQIIAAFIQNSTPAPGTGKMVFAACKLLSIRTVSWTVVHDEISRTATAYRGVETICRFTEQDFTEEMFSPRRSPSQIREQISSQERLLAAHEGVQGPQHDRARQFYSDRIATLRRELAAAEIHGSLTAQARQMVNSDGEVVLEIRNGPNLCVPSPGVDTTAARTVTASEAAAILGRAGGLKGGKARAAALSPDRRREIASKASKKRWDAVRASRQPAAPENAPAPAQTPRRTPYGMAHIPLCEQCATTAPVSLLAWRMAYADERNNTEPCSRCHDARSIITPEADVRQCLIPETHAMP